MSTIRGLPLLLLVLIPTVAQANVTPVVDNLSATATAVVPGGVVSVQVDGHDPDCPGTCDSSAGCGEYIRADLNHWTADGGTFENTDNGISGSPFTSTTDWRAPTFCEESAEDFSDPAERAPALTRHRAATGKDASDCRNCATDTAGTFTASTPPAERAEDVANRADQPRSSGTLESLRAPGHPLPPRPQPHSCYPKAHITPLILYQAYPSAEGDASHQSWHLASN